MLSRAVEVGLVLFVFATPFVLLALTARVARARGRRVGRQIAVTEAIHRELGAIVAPFVTRRGRNAWQVSMAVPLDRPGAVERILAIAYDTLATETLAAPPEVSFVLTARPRRAESLLAPSSDSIYPGGNPPGKDPSCAGSRRGRWPAFCSLPRLSPPPARS